MPNTPANDAPFVIGAIEDAISADYPGLPFASAGDEDDNLNPIVVNADGSFVAAVAVIAPSYFVQFSIIAAGSPGTVSSLPPGTAGLQIGGGVAREYFFSTPVAASPGSVTVNLTGRDIAGNTVSIVLTPEGNSLTITEAILNNFAPGTPQSLTFSGLTPGSTISGGAEIEVSQFYDAAAPTLTVQASGSTTVTASGVATLGAGPGLTEAFVLQNTGTWTTGATSYRIILLSQEPLDLTGLSGGILQNNVLSNGSYLSIITVAAVGDIVAVPPTILQQLESRPATVVLQAIGAVAGAVPQAQAVQQLPVTIITEGLYTQKFDADGNPAGPAVRVDTAANAVILDEDDQNFIMSRSGDGGLMIAWVGNADEDGAVDAIYVRKLDDAGNPTAAAVALTGISAEAFFAITESENGDAVLAGLADGGFALAYSVEPEEISIFASGTASPAALSLAGIAGQLERVELTQFTAAGAVTGQLRGEAPNGAAFAVNVTITNGVFQMTDALRAQFAADSHLSLAVSGLTANTAYAAVITTRDAFEFDGTGTVTTVNRQATAANNVGTIPDVFIASGQGQPQSFKVNTITAASGETPAYLVSLFTTAPIDLAGSTQYTGTPISGILANAANAAIPGGFLNTIVVTPVAGLVAIPAAILDQIEGDGLRALLGISGLQSGTAVSVDITLQQPSLISSPGIFTQTFGSNGVAEGAAIQIDLAGSGLLTDAPADEGDSSLGIIANSDGTYRVTWIGGGEDETIPPRIISREFSANGAPVGTVLDIDAADIPSAVAAGEAGAEIYIPDQLQMVELGNGGFATLLQVEADEEFNTSVNVVATAAPLSITAPNGRLESLVINQAVASPSGVHYFVSGTGAGGAPLSVEVFPVNGRITIPASLSAQFQSDSPLSIRAEGLQSGSTFNGFTSAADVWNFSAASPVATTQTSLTVGAELRSFAFAPKGEATAFDVTNVTSAPGLTASYGILVITANQLNTPSIGLPAQTPFANGGWSAFIPVTPNGSGIVTVPDALLVLTEGTGAQIVLVANNLAAGSTFAADTTARLPVSTVNEGLFVQLFSADGTPTGDLIRVDSPTTTAMTDDDNALASIQSDGNGGFRVVWKSDVDGDEDSDGINIRNFNQNGVAIGDVLTVSSIPDRIYDKNAAVTLYTSGIFADPDPGDVLTFSAAGLPTGLTINSTTGVIGGATSQVGLFAVTVTATDSGGLSASSAFEVFITGEPNPNAGPTAVALANTVTSTAENGGSLKVADIVVTDDGEGTNTLALSGANASAFSIVGGALHFNGAGNFEGLAAYSVTVSASDASTGAAAVSASFNLALTDVSENQFLNGGDEVNTLNVNPLSIDNWTVSVGGGNDVITTGAGVDSINGGAGNDTLSSGDGGDTIEGGIGDDTINGGENVDTAVVSGNRAGYTVTQTATGVFTVTGQDGTDTLTNVEFLRFGDETIRLLPGTAQTVNFETSDPTVYQAAMENIRDFDGNDLGGDGAWLRIGSADIDGDGDIDQLLVNDSIGRFAIVSGTDDGQSYFSDFGWAGGTRVVGIYVDPLVASGEVVAGSDNDSQRRFQNDLQIENINRVLGADDYDGDGLYEVYFGLTDGTAYLHAYLHADGNIQYANYQSQAQVIEYLTQNGFGSDTHADWFT